MNVSPTPAPAVSTVIRIGLSLGTGERDAVYRLYTAVQPEPIHTWTHMALERGDLRRESLSRDWMATPAAVLNFTEDPLLAKQVSGAVQDAYQAFLALGIAPNGGPSVLDAPDFLTIESDLGHWSFARIAAPAEAWAMYHAAAEVLTASMPALDPNGPDEPKPAPMATALSQP